MSTVTKYCLHVFSWNAILLFVLGCSFFLYGDGLTWLAVSFIIYIVSLFVQLLVGFGLLLNSEYREWGKAMLLVVGIIFLIGFSVCSAINGRFLSIVD